MHTRTFRNTRKRKSMEASEMEMSRSSLAIAAFCEMTQSSACSLHDFRYVIIERTRLIILMYSGGGEIIEIVTGSCADSSWNYFIGC